MAGVGEFLKISWKKVLLAIGIVFILTPVISVFLYPMPYVGAASGQAHSEEKALWGIYPFTFMGVAEWCYYPCDVRSGGGCSPSCSYELEYAVFDVLGDWGTAYGAGLEMEGTLPNILADLAINLVLAYLASCALVSAWKGAAKKA
ncbi:MAG: hypothetical protein PHY95_04870 [Candidatus ainarchaeum sp.]|nr:hypothetical protein [Candidatus ainarchaeum sp.]